MADKNPTTIQRMHSTTNFKSATTDVASQNMRKELDRMVEAIETDQVRKDFDSEMNSFYYLFSRYLLDRATGGETFEWDRIKPPTEQQIVPYSTLPESKDTTSLLNKLAVLKLNGGLGTTMGLKGPKSVIEVHDGLSFLDLSVRQISSLNTTYDVNVPFVLMNSFNTDKETKNIVKKYANNNIDIKTFNQSRFPRVVKADLSPLPKSADDDKSTWYPPGHGDIFDSIYRSGVLDELIADGKEYLFMSNVDNLGAVVDLNILQHMDASKAEFIMEVTDKTKADVKGGTLINYDNEFRLLEVAQVPEDHIEDFKSVRKFKVFNTNNLWINLKAIKRVVEQQALELEIIVNNKVSDNGTAVVQLETAVGAAIRFFNNAHGVNVPRSRFLPVKSCADLLLITSDLYTQEHGRLVMNPNRMFSTTPVVKLSDHFKKMADFIKRFKTIPEMLELDHLTVSGDVYFGRNVILRGTVIIVANDGARIELPDGVVLENKLVSGNLHLFDH